MGESFGTLRLAAVQAAAVMLNREESVRKVCHLILEAGDHGADDVGFPAMQALGARPGAPIQSHERFRPESSTWRHSLRRSPWTSRRTRMIEGRDVDV